MKFCKLFDIDDDQVLYKKTEDEDEPAISCSVAVSFGEIENTWTYQSEEIRDRAFDEIDTKQAKASLARAKDVEAQMTSEDES